MNLLIIIPVHRDPEVTPWFLKPLAGRSALGRTIDYAHAMARRLPGERVDVAVHTNDASVEQACAQEPGVYLPGRTQEELYAAYREALEKSEAHHGLRYDVVYILEPPHAFRQPSLGVEAMEMLRADPGLDSVVAVEPLRGRIWSGDGNCEPLADSFHREGGVSSHPYRELLGLLLASRREVILSGERIGSTVGLLVVERKWSFLDIRSAESFEIAERLEPLYHRTMNGGSASA